MQKMNTTQRLSVILGISLAVVMGLSMVLPALTRNNLQSAPTVAPPTTTPLPTFPPPITNFSNISFDTDYLHPSGMLVVSQPSGWTPTTPFNNVAQVQANFNNSQALSVIETYIEKPVAPITSLDEVSGRFNTSALQASWARYTRWNELSRRQENNRLIIDFELERARQIFLARHIAWYDDDYIYVARVVVPENAPELLFFMVEAMTTHIRPLEQFTGTPLEWTSLFDDRDQHIIRFPGNWIITDGGRGLPASIESAEGTRVRVEARDGSIDDEAAARVFVEGLRPGATVVSVEETTRTGGAGFVVAYQFANADGDGQSGLVVLLNGDDGRLHIANASVPAAGLDLTSEEARAAYFELTTALDTFSLLMGLNLPQPEAPPPTATPTPVPTAIPTPAPETTPEATDEDAAADEAEAESTPEAEDSGG